jgi:hypothetical protein
MEQCRRTIKALFAFLVSHALDIAKGAMDHRGLVLEQSCLVDGRSMGEELTNILDLTDLQYGSVVRLDHEVSLSEAFRILQKDEDGGRQSLFIVDTQRK